MKKLQRVQHALLRRPVDRYPIFMSGTPQFWRKVYPQFLHGPSIVQMWEYCLKLNLDIIQIGHPSFYPVKVLEYPLGTRYNDSWGRTHQISEYFDDFVAPFPLQKTSQIDLTAINTSWKNYHFPDLTDPTLFTGLDSISSRNADLEDPLCIWGVINGPLEPTWQLMSDGWPTFFILARRNRALAEEILQTVTDICIQAGRAMIQHGVHALRIGDDYAINSGLMCDPKLWYDLIFPAHRRLVLELKTASRSDFPIILHSDGNIMALLSWLTSSGIDALNPIQPDALDFHTVVNTIGHKLAMTGAFDLRYFLKAYNSEVQHLLDLEVERLFTVVDQFNLNRKPDQQTGYCIGPSHQVQAGSDVTTFEAWVRTVHLANNRRQQI